MQQCTAGISSKLALQISPTKLKLFHKAKQMYSKCKDQVLIRARAFVLPFHKPHATEWGVDLSHESPFEQKAKSNVKFRGNSPTFSFSSSSSSSIKDEDRI